MERWTAIDRFSPKPLTYRSGSLSLLRTRIRIAPKRIKTPLNLAWTGLMQAIHSKGVSILGIFHRLTLSKKPEICFELYRALSRLIRVPSDSELPRHHSRLVYWLHQTQNFFFQQRLIWAMIVIVIGMSPTSGASLFGFAGRIFGTITSLALSLIVWYIVDEKTPGVLVPLFVANCFEVRSSVLGMPEFDSVCCPHKC